MVLSLSASSATAYLGTVLSGPRPQWLILNPGDSTHDIKVPYPGDYPEGQDDVQGYFLRTTLNFMGKTGGRGMAELDGSG